MMAPIPTASAAISIRLTLKVKENSRGFLGIRYIITRVANVENIQVCLKNQFPKSPVSGRRLSRPVPAGSWPYIGCLMLLRIPCTPPPFQIASFSPMGPIWTKVSCTVIPYFFLRSAFLS